jgi:hypothetical protein
MATHAVSFLLEHNLQHQSLHKWFGVLAVKTEDKVLVFTHSWVGMFLVNPEKNAETDLLEKEKAIVLLKR